MISRLYSHLKIKNIFKISSIGFSTELVKEWTPQSKRTGVIAMKIGMISCWDSWGARIPCTVCQIDNCQVIEIKTIEKHGYSALQLGSGAVKIKNVPRTQLFHFEKFGVEAKRKLWEFLVTPDALLPSGTELTVMHFVPGQKVDVCGYSKGKGFQGVMKRWGFHGQPASHGNTKSHRKGGSYGQRHDPGKVWKGKKMPGRMGNDRVTTQGLFLFKIEPKRNLLYIKGSIPGNVGGYLRITDSYVYKFKTPPPFPTYNGVNDTSYTTKEGEVLESEYSAPSPAEDPYKWYYENTIISKKDADGIVSEKGEKETHKLEDKNKKDKPQEDAKKGKKGAEKDVHDKESKGDAEKGKKSEKGK